MEVKGADAEGTSVDSDVVVLGMTAASYVRRYNFIGHDSVFVDRECATEAANVCGSIVPSDTVH